MFILQAIHYVSSWYTCLLISANLKSSIICWKSLSWDFPTIQGLRRCTFTQKSNQLVGELRFHMSHCVVKKRKESLTLVFKVFEADSAGALSHTLSAIMSTPKAIDGHDSQPAVKFSSQALVFLLSLRHFPNNWGVRLVAYSSNPDKGRSSYLTPQFSTNAEWDFKDKWPNFPSLSSGIMCPTWFTRGSQRDTGPCGSPQR